MYKKLSKIIVGMLVFMLAFSNLSIIGIYGQQVYAADGQVSFDAYFVNAASGESAIERTKNKITSLTDEDNFFIALSFPGQGYLKNAIVDFTGANFNIAKDRMSNGEEYKKGEGNQIIINQTKHSDILNIMVPYCYDELTQGIFGTDDVTRVNKVKLTGTYVNESGVETAIEEEVELTLTWKIGSTLEVVNKKLIPYNVNGTKGLMAQVTIQSGVYKNLLATNKSEISFSIPKILEIEPTVEVRANTTEATNGDKTGSNINVKQQDGIVTISVENKADENGNIKWEKNVKDEFVITYVYPAEVIDKIIEKGSYTFSNEIKSKITAYLDSSTLELEENILQVEMAEESVTEENLYEKRIGEFVDILLEKQTEYIPKGQMYANYNVSQKIETEFRQSITADITYKDLIDEVIIEEYEDMYQNEKLSESSQNILNEIPALDTYNKTISIEKTAFDKILGEEGTIKIYRINGMEPDGTLIGTINKDTTIQDENYIIDISSSDAGCIKMVTSKPIAEGKLEVQILKAITGGSSHTKEDLKTYRTLGLTAHVRANNIAEEVVELQDVGAKTSIELREPTAQAEATINKETLSTVVTNENVKITAVLKTDTLDCELFENPVIEFVLPAEIEAINNSKVDVLFETEGSKLTAKEANIIPNADGTKTIRIELEGKQTEYTLGAISKGVNVVVSADIVVNRLTPSKNSHITFKYQNGNKTIPQTIEKILPISFSAPTGVFTISNMSNYAEGATLTAISEEEKTVLIETAAEARNVTITKEVVNNYNDIIRDISILGRVPSKGNKEILTGKDLGSTKDMPLTSAITVNGVEANSIQIYYSENADATKDLQDATNGWTLTPANLANVKSYLIKFINNELAKGESISFTYNAQIPANLQHNESAYENSVTYFDNVSTGTTEEKVVATKLGVTTGTGPVLEATMSSNVDEQTAVKTGKFIKYNVTVKNTGKQVAENVVATVKIPNCTNYIEFFEGESGLYTTDYQKESIVYEIGSIEPNETIEKEFWVIVDRLELTDICKDESHYETSENGEKYHKTDITHSKEDYVATISTKATISAKDLAKEIESNEVKNTVKKAFFGVSTGTFTNGVDDLSEGDLVEFNISVNMYDNDMTLENTKVKVVIPEELTYQRAEIQKYNSEKNEFEILTDGITYDEKTRTVTINLGQVNVQDGRKIYVISKVNELPEGEYERTVSSIATVSADDMEEETSTPIIDRITKEAIEVSQTCTIPEGYTITEGEDFSYKFVIKNIGARIANNVSILDKLPESLQYISTEYIVSGERKTLYNIDENNTTEININIPKGENAEIIINVVAKAVSEDTKITNQATVSSDTINTKKSNVITHTIEKVNYELPNEGEEQGNVTRKIMGTVWKDINNDGIKDNDEEKVPNVEVLLFNNATANLVRDDEGNVIRVKTNSEGVYTFEKIPQGKYTVIFLYDIANYSATVYRKAEVDETKNSDAVDAQITLDGEIRTAAITEEVVITDSNIYNLDLGLIENKKFDLKLDKVVSKITVQDSTGTNVYDFADAKIAKKDLVGKQVNNTTIIVEYKMIVTNEGAIPGYVKKVADYLPSEMKFNSELNRDWYAGENGVIYNSSLANTLINPGESKTITLLLTKKMTEDNLGSYKNTAEIYEAYNDLGIEDIDSIEGNKKSNEDDISSAEVLISVKTGEAILFVGLTITIITTIGIGAYFIKKKVLR